MNSRHNPLLLSAMMLFVLLLADGCAGEPEPYSNSFDSAGTWGVGTSDEVIGTVENGVYTMRVESSHGLYLSTAGENFAGGVFEVEATQIDGPLNNGYGMILRLEDETDSFYIFEISGDGFIWIGYCSNLCDDEAVALVGGDWFRSPAVNQGLQATNRLRVVAEGPRMTFFVNGIQVGRTSDTRLTEGDIAVMVETLGQSGVEVVFDNFKVTP